MADQRYPNGRDLGAPDSQPATSASNTAQGQPRPGIPYHAGMRPLPTMKQSPQAAFDQQPAHPGAGFPQGVPSGRGMQRPSSLQQNPVPGGYAQRQLDNNGMQPAPYAQVAPRPRQNAYPMRGINQQPAQTNIAQENPPSRMRQGVPPLQQTPPAESPAAWGQPSSPRPPQINPRPRQQAASPDGMRPPMIPQDAPRPARSSGAQAPQGAWQASVQSGSPVPSAPRRAISATDGAMRRTEILSDAQDLSAQLEAQRAQTMDEYTRRPPLQGAPMYEPQAPQAMPQGAIPGVGIPSSHWEQQRRATQRPPEQRPSGQRLPEQRLSEQRLSEQHLSEPHLPEQRLPEQRLPEQRLPEQRLLEQRLPEQRLPEQRSPERRASDGGIPRRPASTANAYSPSSLNAYMQGGPTVDPFARPAGSASAERSASPVPNALPAFDPAAAPQEGGRRRRAARAQEASAQAAPVSEAPAYSPSESAAASRRSSRRGQSRAEEAPDAYAASYANPAAEPTQGAWQAEETPARAVRGQPTLDVPSAMPEASLSSARFAETDPMDAPDGLTVEGYQTPEPNPVPNAFFSTATKRLKSMSPKVWILIGAGALVVIALIVLLATGALGGGSSAAPVSQSASNPYINAPSGLSEAGQGETPLQGWSVQPTAEPPMADTAADGPSVISFTADPGSAAAPVNVAFTLVGNDKIASLKLLQADDTQLPATLQSMPSADGVTYTYTIRFEQPYSGSIRAFLMDEQGSWYQCPIVCDISIQ